MYSYGKSSMKHYETCCDELKEVLGDVIKIIDCSILCGHRGEDEQNRHYDLGNSKLRFPHSKHNSLPSRAVDLAPYCSRIKSIDWSDHNSFYFLAGLMIGIGRSKGYDIRWGGDWDKDGDFKDQTFNDLPHFEYCGRL